MATLQIETDFIAKPCINAVLATRVAATLGVLVDFEAKTFDYRR